MTQAMHPHVIDGAALWASMFGKEASSDPVVVSLPSLLEVSTNTCLPPTESPNCSQAG